MSKKDKLHYKCQECEYTQLKWSGRCPSCMAWNSLEEIVVSSHPIKTQDSYASVVKLHQVNFSEELRIRSCFKEMDQVLGGGIVSGSAVLLGGEPGIGKSTLLLQLMCSFARQNNALYVSGEESVQQIKMRATRLDLEQEINVYPSSDLSGILYHVQSTKPQLVVIDSIQMLYDTNISFNSGTISQVKHCVQEIIRHAKTHNIVIFFVAHVTKDGIIAGPKAIEHLVDTVLYFEQGENNIRLLRAVKNRFGAIDELGVFNMTHTGLQELNTEFYHQIAFRESVVGSSMTAVLEGSRIFFYEIQALVVRAKANFSRIYSEHIDSQRIARISAILEKYLSISFNEYDIYLNVSGGVHLKETGIDLAIALALYSAKLNIILPEKLVSSGELTLSGGVRWTSHINKKIKMAEELKFNFFTGAQLLKLPISNQTEKYSEHNQQMLTDLMRNITSL